MQSRDHHPIVVTFPYHDRNNHIGQKSIRAEIIQVVPCSANNTGERKGHLLLMLLLQEKRKRSIDPSIGRRKKNKDSRRNMQCGAEAL